MKPLTSIVLLRNVIRERTKPLSCILVGTVFLNDQPATLNPTNTSANSNNVKKSYNSLRGTTKQPPPPPARSHSSNGTPTTPTTLAPTPHLDSPTSIQPEKSSNETTQRDAQDLCALFDTSLIRLVFRNQQADRFVIRDLFVQLVREVLFFSPLISF